VSSVFQLYGRPLAEDTPLPSLGIVGALSYYSPGAAYEGRLQIINPIGKCKVEVVQSSLPPGAYAYVDNVTKEVVLKWPEYVPPDNKTTDIPNGDFELGDQDWELPVGMTIVENEVNADPDTPDSHWTAQFRQGRRGEYFLKHRLRVPVSTNDRINLSARVQQGASSKGNTGAAVQLYFTDADGNELAPVEGSMVNSGSNGEWHTSELSASSPITGTVQLGARVYRHKQNKRLWLDNFEWDHAYSVGTDELLDYSVTFKVTDSANRTAFWSGVVPFESFYYTSQLMPVFQDEHAGFAVSVESMEHTLANKEVDGPDETALYGMTLVGFEMKAQPRMTSTEDAGYAVTLTDFTHSSPIQRSEEAAGYAVTVVGFDHRKEPHGFRTEDAGYSITITGFVHE